MFRTLWSLIDGEVGIVGGGAGGEGGWKIFQILIGGGAGIVGGLENFPNLNSRGVIFQNFKLKVMKNAYF